MITKHTVLREKPVVSVVRLHPFNGLFSRTTWVSRYQKGKTSLDLNESRHDGVSGCSGISWTIRKQPAPRCRQITTPTPHRSIFYGPGALPVAKPTVCQSTEGKRSVVSVTISKFKRGNRGQGQQTSHWCLSQRNVHEWKWILWYNYDPLYENVTSSTNRTYIT